MKRTIIFLFLTISFLNGYSQFNDDFSDGDFSQNPTWFGDTSIFIVNAQNEFQLNDVVSSEAHAVTQSQAILNASWEAKIRMDFDPSSSNYCRFYLVSDQPDLKGILNGYFLRIGGVSGDGDDVSLYRQDGTSETLLIDGADSTVGLTPEVHVRVNRQAGGQWELEIDTALNGTFQSQGTATDNTYTNAQYTGVFCDYTSTRADKFFFDDFVVTGTPVPDTIPPSIDSLVIVSNSELDVFFSESLDQQSAETDQNYSVDQSIGNPSNATLDSQNDQLVHLTFSSTFSQGSSYMLSASNIEDQNNNVSGTLQESFVYFIPQTPVAKDVIINEFMADPTPPVGQPDAEYIELYNNSNKSFDLSGWTISDASSTVSLPGYPLLAGEYAVIIDSDDSSLFSNVNNLVLVNSLPALNNGGDNIVLTDGQSLVIDSLSYETSWYGDPNKSSGGYSLELINPNAICGGANNWKASEDPSGGTPGVQNSVFNTQPDVTPPGITSVSIPDSSTIQLQFNEGIDTALSTNSFILSPLIQLSGITINDLSSISLNLASPLDSAQIYDLLVQNISDCPGNTLNDTTIKIAIGKTPQPFELVINELYPDPDPQISNLPDAEFVEIFNTTQKALNLNGLSITDGISTTSLPNEILLPGEYAIIIDDDFTLNYLNYGKLIPVSSLPSLNNSSDQIVIYSQSQTIDRVNYNSSWYGSAEKAGGGYTLERISPFDFCSGDENWKGSDHPDGGTPGSENSVFDPNSTVPDPALTSVKIDSLKGIRAVFNRRVDSTTIISANFELSPNPGIDSVYYSPSEPNEAIIIIASDLVAGQNYTLTATNILDCAGAIIGSGNSVDFSLPTRGTVVINEVLFNPRSGGSDFVELYNPNDMPVDVTGWGFQYVSNNGDTSVNAFENQQYVIEPDGYVVLTEEPENILLEYPNAVEENIFESDLPTYPNDEGRVTLVSTLSDTIDDFYYNEDYHFELLNDLNGISLERISHERNTMDATNWHSASEVVGFATPGYENSQGANLEVEPNEITVSPETFSPDNDGYNDVVSIGYELDEPGYVANIKIFDSNGREVKELANNKLLDRKGALSWNGINENSEKCGVGVYVIYVELFSLKGDVETFKKTCVLATRF